MEQLPNSDITYKLPVIRIKEIKEIKDNLVILDFSELNKEDQESVRSFFNKIKNEYFGHYHCDDIVMPLKFNIDKKTGDPLNDNYRIIIRNNIRSRYCRMDQKDNGIISYDEFVNLYKNKMFNYIRIKIRLTKQTQEYGKTFILANIHECEFFQ